MSDFTHGGTGFPERVLAGFGRIRMLTALQCMAKAEEMDARAVACPHLADRMSYTGTAACWREAAVLARKRQLWANV